uniref:Putative secreted protein n=1 Tax=Xenopsylla cheopis TaxID=163159 RepID=A0A6M2DZ33_XENCH
MDMKQLSAVIFLLCVGIGRMTQGDTETKASTQNLKQDLLFINEGRMLATAEKWNLVIDVNLTEYENANDDMQLWIRGLQDTENPLRKGKSLINTTSYLSMEYEMIKEMCLAIRREIDDISHATYPRWSRELVNGLGTVLKFLAGTPDNRDLEGINMRLQELENQFGKIRHLQKIQATLINATYDLSRQNTAQINTLIRITTEHRIEILEMEREKAEREEILEVVEESKHVLSANFRVLESLIAKLENELTKLRIALEKAVEGKLSALFLPPTELYDTLSDIQKLLPSTLSFPQQLRKSTIYEFYDLISVRTATWGSSFRLFIELPLKTSQREFTVFRALPLPHFDNASKVYIYIKPENKYFAISDDRSKFMELSDLNDCRGTRIRICAPHVPIQIPPGKTGHAKMIENTCMKYVARNFRSVWYKGDNKWVYSLTKPVEIIIRCDHSVYSR